MLSKTSTGRSSCHSSKPCNFLAFNLAHSDNVSVTFIYFIKINFSQIYFNIVLKRRQNKRGKQTTKQKEKSFPSPKCSSPIYPYHQNVHVRNFAQNDITQRAGLLLHICWHRELNVASKPSIISEVFRFLFSLSKYTKMEACLQLILNPLAPNDIYIYIYTLQHTANLQTLHFK